ncbi:MAG: amidohydrolase [Bacteroides sp.]|nr:MAG: amidohydrolase [Bacteroides sp.]
MLIDQIRKLSDKLFQETICNRRHIHSNPELSFKEYNTQKFILQYLNKNRIKNNKITNTGVYGYIEGNKSIKNNKNILLRADMDALPINELNNVKYKSQNNGIMHACGHDVHVASLLTTLKIINNLKDNFSGTVRFVFQPGEEKYPGGASKIVKSAIFKKTKFDYVLGQHVFPFLDAGSVGFKLGKYMASSDEIYITIKGVGGHAATPHLNIDPIIIGSHIIIGLQQIISRNNDPRVPSVLSFGTFHASGSNNVIPSIVTIEGTFRTFNEKWRYEAHNIMKKMVNGIAKSMGGNCNFIIKKGYPLLVNDIEFTNSVMSIAKQYLGNNKVEEIDIWMGSEDFAFYTQNIKGCFYRLGTRNTKKNIIYPVHTPFFDIDENALNIGAGLMAYIAITKLMNNQSLSICN